MIFPIQTNPTLLKALTFVSPSVRRSPGARAITPCRAADASIVTTAPSPCWASRNVASAGPVSALRRTVTDTMGIYLLLLLLLLLLYIIYIYYYI